MRSTSETGHAVNVVNFESLVEHCLGFGPHYAPSNPTLTVTALQVKLADSQAALDAYRTARTAAKNAGNARGAAFRDLRPLATRVINALKASGASPQTVADAQTRLNSLRGSRRTPVQAPAAQPGTLHDADTPAAATDVPATTRRTVSSSHQSYVQLAENFAAMLEVLIAEPLYQPAEAGLSVAELQTYRVTLATTATGVIQQAVVYENVRDARNAVLYDADTSLIALASAVKSYTKSVYGARSPQYRSINALRFSRPRT